MKNLLALIVALFFLIGCKEEDISRDKGLILLEPTQDELAEWKLAVGDTLKVTVMYEGLETVLAIRGSCTGEAQYSGYTQSTSYFSSYFFPVYNKVPLTLSWVIPQWWESSGTNIISRTLHLEVIKENQTIEYDFPLSPQ